MKIWLYDAKDDGTRAVSHKQIGRNLQALPGGREYRIEVKVNRNVRSLPQNAMLHAIAQIYAIYTGHTVDEIKDMWKKEYWFEWKTNKLGQEYKRLKSVTEAEDTKTFSELINTMLQWGQKAYPECIVPRPEDINYIRLMEIQNEYSESFNQFS